MSKMRSLNHLLVILTCAASLWAWMALPDMERYPIHWNARGEADGFGTKAGVAMVLLIMPITAISTHWLMWFLTRIDVIKEQIKQSGPVYDITWHVCLWLFLGLNIAIAATYMSLVAGQPLSSSGDVMLKFMPAALGLVFIIIGNVLGKAKQNKYVGVKTPWTFKSKSTWDATHRFSSWLWVLGGAALMVAPFFFSIEVGVIIIVTLVLVLSFLPILYSYLFYRTATDKEV